MTKENFLRISLTRKEILWGLQYLLFHTVFLTSLLHTANWALGTPLDTTGINLVFFSINFAAALLIFHRYLKQFLQVDAKSILRIVGFGILFFAVYRSSTALLSHAFSLICPELVNLNDRDVTAMIEGNYFLMFIGTVLFVPVAEECFHRGLVFRGLYDRSPVAAFFVSAAVFSAIHIIHYVGSYAPVELFLSFVQYLPAGLCLAGAYRLSGSLLCPIFIHMAVNAMGMLALR